MYPYSGIGRPVDLSVDANMSESKHLPHSSELETIYAMAPKPGRTSLSLPRPGTSRYEIQFSFCLHEGKSVHICRLNEGLDNKSRLSAGLSSFQ